MRAYIFLAILTVASMPRAPEPLSTDSPQVLVENADCAAAQRSARAIGEALGFSELHSTCSRGAARGSFAGPTAPRLSPIRNLATYSAPAPRYVSEPGVNTTFQVPGDVPWVSAKGSLVGYFKVDAALLRLQADDLLAIAFALENAGIPRDDIMSEPFEDGSMYVRVQPVTIAQVLKIAGVAEKFYKPPEHFRYSESVFVRDCDGAIASLSGLAIAAAREKASVMARAARTQLGEALGVIDPGGHVLDAVCGLGSDATVQQLAAAARSASNSNTVHGELQAAIVRSISVAWRLKLPAPPAGEPWYNAPDFFSGRLSVNGARVAFVADGRRAHGESLLPRSVVPNRAYILIPDWAYASVKRSAYARALEYIGVGMAPSKPALMFASASAADLKRQVSAFQAYASALGSKAGQRYDLGVLYTQDDCRAALDAALFRATTDAMAKLNGQPVRYLQETQSGIYGETGFCMHYPIMDEAWSPKYDFAAAAASVAVGY